MRKKAFTLVEILIALIVVAVVASLSVVTFQKTINTNNDRICRQNLKTLQQAIEIYTIENNALPVTLSLLTDEQIRLASEKVFGKPKENRLAIFFNNLIGVKPLFADLGKFYGNDPKVRRCPADKTVSADPGYSSYSLNSNFFASADDLEDNSGTALLYDSGYYHKKNILSSEMYQIGINPDGDYGTWVSSDGGVTEHPETGGIPKMEPLYGTPWSATTVESHCPTLLSKDDCKATSGCRWKKGECRVKCSLYTSEPCPPTSCKWKESKHRCTKK